MNTHTYIQLYYLRSSFSFTAERYIQFSCIALLGFTYSRPDSFHVNTQLGVGAHWWFNYPGPLLDVELEFAC